MHTGSCLCGAITFTVSAPLKGPDACHCGQCRKQSGHYWASTDVKRSDLSITGEEHVRWYQSSPKVRRGFCDTCGSFLFWDPPHRDSMAVAMGAFDEAIAEVKRARELDPLSLIINAHLSDVLYYARDFDGYITHSLETL